jgi:hypothetical protein
VATSTRIEIGSIDDNGATYLAIEPHAGRALLTAVAATGDVAMIPLTPDQAREAALTLLAFSDNRPTHIDLGALAGAGTGQ